MSADTIEAGDVVFIGKPGPRKVHWDVLWHRPGQDLYQLQSGMTERRRFATSHNLILFKKGVQHDTATAR